MPTVRSNILLITATITPRPGVPNLARADPKIRLQDYEKSLKFYLLLLNHGVDSIVFAENSNSDISSLRNITAKYGVSDRVEFVVCDGLDYPPSYDRGYGEFKLLDYTMNHSEFINAQNEQREIIVWKVTGRYMVNNLAQLIARKPSNFDLYCNFRNFPKHWTDMYLLAWTLRGYQACLNNVYHRLKTNVPEVPQGVAAEELLRNLLDRPPENIKLVRRFNVTPKIYGIRGADNKGYSTDNFWKFYVRNTIRILFPWMWI
ncbi:MAG: hypothetical protein ACRC62_17835 [Microcoleus sp.]